MNKRNHTWRIDRLWNLCASQRLLVQLLIAGTQEITGVTTLAAGSGNDITLNTSTNNFAAAVVITSGKDRNVAITDEDAIDLGAATVSGTYNASATSGRCNY